MTARGGIDYQKEQILRFLHDNDASRIRGMAMALQLPRRTLQRRLQELVNEKRVFSDQWGGYSIPIKPKSLSGNYPS